VINRKAPGEGYVTSWRDMIILEGVEKAISMCRQAGFGVILVTNQRCVAKGLISQADLQELHDQLCSLLSARGAKLDALYCCLHEEHSCDCRKPHPGMLLRAAQDHAIDMPSSWMIGDSTKDVQAGKRAGCKTALLGVHEANPAGEPDLQAGTLLEAVHKILSSEPGSSR
jgi:histidinol-phosphate phosphatase family protein